jgi:ribosomal protein L37AE/L43A
MEETTSKCQACGKPNPSKFYKGMTWMCHACSEARNATSTADWCAATGERIHRYSDHTYWNDENHPTCDFCGFVDRARRLK